MASWWAGLQRWRERRILERRAIPDALWAQTLERYPFLTLPDPDEAGRLRALTTLFLARKEFHGARGLEITDEMAVCIAAQACLPVLNLGLDHYDGFVGIVVHADQVVARRSVIAEDGVPHHYQEELAGEAMEGGPVMLSWQDVADAGDTAEVGYNVVVHEFAHVLDMLDGQSDGMPPLPNRAMHDRWSAVFSAEYEAFCADVDNGVDTLLDPYASEGPDEFFAVACEVFFVSPDDLRRNHPAVYELLATYFRQDPSSRFGRRR